MSSLAKHVIKQPKPLRWLGFILAIIGTTLAIQWYVNQNSSVAQQQLLAELEHLQLTLEQQLHIQTAQNQQLNESNAKLNIKLTEQQHHLAIQQATDQQLQQQVVELQNDLINLNKELVFYQTVTQGNSSSKLQIRNILLQADEHSADTFRYRVVITQGQKITKALTGAITISTTTKRNGKTENITVKEHSLNLRHVQVIEGQLKITDNIEPEKIIITIKQKKKKTVSQVFDWKVEGSY
ncbi:hypothetical protein A9Q79_02200 [Methylophaga sp. 42_25_T18]|nr:hypothetical protein A9Q79_02200 [Methylophaga sp. 42_25_T18]OUR86835.1 hypothetical protein A9Q92_05120 [Methylophaga sp. 42_8_T64]